MSLIRPITDLENTNKISKMCHDTKEPIFITKNDYVDMVIMSMDVYDEITNVSKIDVAKEIPVS